MADSASNESTPTWADVLALVAQLDASGLEDAEVVTAGLRVRVSRTALASRPDPSLAVPPDRTASAPSPGVSAPAAAEQLSPRSRPQAAPVRPGPEITAPMLGVVYHRPSPDEQPFVKVGDAVTEATTVAILEVMKMMNPVTAGVSGTVAEVCVEEGQLVEYGDVLFRLESTA